MITQVFATTIGMSQAWSKSGKRLAICRLKMDDSVVVGKKTSEKDNYQALQIAFGQKKLKNMTKPLKTIVTKSGFSLGRRYIREVKLKDTQGYDGIEVGKIIPFTDSIQVGDIVDVQGTSKGRGFAGGMKRHGFKGGKRTHGQSDRERAPGSIGSGTTPGRVYKGQRMAGHYGVETRTVKNLQVIFINPDTKELWVSGPVPGHINAMVRLSITGHQEFEGLKSVTSSQLSEDSKKEASGDKPQAVEVEKKEKVTEEVKSEKVKEESKEAKTEKTEVKEEKSEKAENKKEVKKEEKK